MFTNGDAHLGDSLAKKFYVQIIFDAEGKQI